MKPHRSEQFWNRTARTPNASKLNIPHPVIAHAAPYLRKTYKVLDLGCGSGKITSDMALKTREVIGVDSAATTIHLAKQTAERRGVKNVQFIESSFRELPFSEKQFDVISAFNVLPYVDNRTEFYNKVLDLLRPGGAFLISTPCLLDKSFSPLHWFLSILSRWHLIPSMTFFSKAAIEEEILQAGFAIDKALDISSVPERFIAARKSQSMTLSNQR